MFDPSHVPSPKYRKTTNVRENSNSNDSDGSYKKLQPQKEGEEEEGEEEEEEQDEEKKVQEEDDVKPVEEQKQEQISESESDSDDDDYNDPNRLWCICKKPHNGRFMISCDNCEEWYHGDCVGITVQRGRQMERRGEEYVCPRCLKQQNKKKNEKMGVSLKGYAHDKKDEMEKRRKNSEEGNKKRRKSSDGVSKLPKKLRKCIVSTCNNRAQADSVYCSNVCILRHAKESLVVVTKAKRDSITKPSVGDKQESREERITRKIREALAKGKVAVVCRKTSKIFSNASAPLKADLSVFLRQNPSFQVLKVPKKSRYAEEGLKRKSSSQNVEERKNTNPYDMDPDYKPKDLLEHKPSNPYKQHRLPSGGEIEKARKHKLEREESTEAKKSKHKKVMDQERRNSSDRHPQKIPPHKRDSRSLSDDRNETKRESPSKKDGEVRKSVHKSLMNILQNRSNNSEDLKMHPSSITKLVMKIEESLYKLFGGVTSKYKNRYRSIMFNLKDEKNQGLWRKVILGEVTSSSLVKMTAEEMASKELAQWRKHELTQELEMIHELETSKNNARPVAKITHKGEIVINEDFSDLTESHLDTSNEKSAPTMAPHRVRRISANQPDSVSDTSLLAVDTTTQHSNHLFDMNCRICTGQVKEEDAAMEESSHKKVKRHTSIILSNEAQVSTETEQTDEELIQKISSYNIKPENPILSPSKSTLTKKDSTDDSELEAGTPEEDKSVLDEEKPESEKETDDKIYNATKPTAVTPSKLNRDHFLWTGVISMPELASFHTNAYSVSGNTKDLSNLIPLKLVLDGRIHPKVVWDYLAKVSSFPNKEVCVVQFRASSEDDRVGYVSMLSYFSSRRRFGVVSNQNTQVIKDIYLVPLLETEKVPNQLLPFKGPGIPDDHPSMLLGVIVRCLATQKKNTPDIPQSVPIKTEPKGKKPRTPDLSETKKSLLDRNRLLAPTMPHFTEKIKNSPGKVEDPAEEEEYNPETADFEVLGEEDLPEESPKHVLPKSEDDDEAYDPEKLTFEDDDDDVPYDPEVEAERLENTELKALQVFVRLGVKKGGIFIYFTQKFIKY